MQSLGNKVAIVTGAAGGLGLAIARQFSGEGCRVALFDIDRDLLDKAVGSVREAGGEAFALQVDVGDRDGFLKASETVMERFGAIDTIVSSALWSRYDPVEDVAEEAVDRIFRVAVKPVIWAAQVAASRMAPGSSLINFSSPVVNLGFRGAAAYTAAKGAVEALTRQLAVELGERGIRVNAISPGPTPTPGSRSIVSESGYEERRARTPSKRLGKPDDVANLASFLASDRSTHISGVTIPVDGGFTVCGI